MVKEALILITAYQPKVITVLGIMDLKCVSLTKVTLKMFTFKPISGMDATALERKSCCWKICNYASGMFVYLCLWILKLTVIV